jgi:hypothetical protein
MDITRLITQVRGTLPWFIPLLLRIGLLKSHWANRTIHYTTHFTLANRKADYRIVWTFSRALSFHGFSSAPDSGVCK